MGARRNSVTTDSAKVVALPRSSAPRGAAALPSSIDHMAAQAELDDKLFPHYLLGRQLALEETMRELLQELPEKARFKLADRLREQADRAMERLQSGTEDAKDEAATCGYICTLLQQGF